MKRRSLVLLALGLTAVLLTTLRAKAAPVILGENQTIKLPSGRSVKVLSVSKVEYSKGVMALLVRYQTTLSVDERKALTEEVDDVWKIAVKEVEHDGYSEAIISSNEVPKGVFLTSSRMQNFIFEKGADGKWTRLGRGDLALQ